MENSEKKLGRGLSALIGENKNKILSPHSKSADVVEIIPVNKIKAGKYQPRQNFDQNEIYELSESIKENGLLQPIILRKAQDDEYEIIAGERRYRASIMAGNDTIPAIIKRVNNHQALELAIIENVQRSDLTIIEEAKGYKRLMDEFSYTQDQIAKKVGKSRSHISNILRLLNLPQKARDLLNTKAITMGHARAIINAENPEEIINRVIDQNLSVRDVEKIMRIKRGLKKDSNSNSKIRFANKDHIAYFEKEIALALKMKVKINYDQDSNSGQITMDFDDFDKIHYFMEKLARDN